MKLINCDLGECLTPDPDKRIMPLINQANIACGGHAGDIDSMKRTVKLAKQHLVQIGAHPSYPDKAHFGRISQQYDASALFELLYQQVSQLNAICLEQGVAMSYIKPHGALYHDMMQSPEILVVMGSVLAAFPQSLDLIVQAGTNAKSMQAFAQSRHLNLNFEAFADRRYQNKQLVPRSEQGVMLLQATEIVEQYQQFSNASALKVDTICFHSDHPPSVKALERIKAMS